MKEVKKSTYSSLSPSLVILLIYGSFIDAVKNVNSVTNFVNSVNNNDAL
jgi:hypothetical protein